MRYHDWIRSKDEVPSVKGLNKRQGMRREPSPWGLDDVRTNLFNVYEVVLWDIMVRKKSS